MVDRFTIFHQLECTNVGNTGLTDIACIETAKRLYPVIRLCRSKQEHNCTDSTVNCLL